MLVPHQHHLSQLRVLGRASSERDCGTEGRLDGDGVHRWAAHFTANDDAKFGSDDELRRSCVFREERADPRGDRVERKTCHVHCLIQGMLDGAIVCDEKSSTELRISPDGDLDRIARMKLGWRARRNCIRLRVCSGDTRKVPSRRALRAGTFHSQCFSFRCGTHETWLGGKTTARQSIFVLALPDYAARAERNRLPRYLKVSRSGRRMKYMLCRARGNPSRLTSAACGSTMTCHA